MSLDQFEPSACRCHQCRQTCHNAPGFCAPGDMERIAAHIGAEPTDAFLQRHFHPVTGPQVTFGDEPIAVPAIRPALIDGRCVFLTSDERCSIHAVRPFGCAACNACQGGNSAATEAVLREIAEDIEYLDAWTGLVYDDLVT